MRISRELSKGRTEEYSSHDFCPGKIVEVRSESEILQTLDENGTYEGLPFQREMLENCGKRFKVLNGVSRMMVEGVGNRCIKNTVVLEGVRCNGEAHGGCKRTCLLLWKKAWLGKAQNNCGQRSSDFHNSFKTEGLKDLKDGALSCQLAMLPVATSRLPASFEDLVRQYTIDTAIGTSEPYKKIRQFLLWLNFKIQRSLGRKKYAALHGVLKKTPTLSLHLLPGELVQVKKKEEILATLDFKGRNRGLSFTAEMLKYCNGRYRVLKRVDRMIIEKTGKIRGIANTVILRGVTCDGSDHWDCPRNCYCLWREGWLERV